MNRELQSRLANYVQGPLILTTFSWHTGRVMSLQRNIAGIGDILVVNLKILKAIISERPMRSTMRSHVLEAGICPGATPLIGSWDSHIGERGNLMMVSWIYLDTHARWARI